MGSRASNASSASQMHGFADLGLDLLCFQDMKNLVEIIELYAEVNQQIID